MKNLFLQVADLKTSSSPLALATVTGTNGSTPQKPGSSALFGKNGLISGTVGGGIVEAKVQNLALKAILSEQSGLYQFNLANDISNAEEAICGGRISVLIDANLKKYIAVIEELNKSLETGIPGMLITKVSYMAEPMVSIERFWMSEKISPRFNEAFNAIIEADFKKLLSDRDPLAFIEIINNKSSSEPVSSYFLQPFFPPDNLLIAGAGHIGKALAHIGKLLDFEVTVIDDRSEYANSINIPDADHIIVKDIEEAMGEQAVGPNTYIVIVTRGHKDDASALKQCIGRNLTYIGMIGSKNKIAAMRQEFITNGWSSEEQWDKIHAPVGLNIKSQTVEEIAISIAAEIVMVRNSRTISLR